MVQQKLNQLANELEDKQIQHERQKQEELRQLEQDKKIKFAEIAEEADEEIQYMKESLATQLKATNQNMSDEAR